MVAFNDPSVAIRTFTKTSRRTRISEPACTQRETKLQVGCQQCNLIECGMSAWCKNLGCEITHPVNLLCRGHRKSVRSETTSACICNPEDDCVLSFRRRRSICSKPDKASSE